MKEMTMTMISWKKNKINVAIQVLPEAEEKIKYELVDAAILAIEKTGLKYQVCPFETVVECSYEELLRLIDIVHESCKKSGTEKMITNLKIQVDFESDVSISEKMEKYC